MRRVRKLAGWLFIIMGWSGGFAGTSGFAQEGSRTEGAADGVVRLVNGDQLRGRLESVGSGWTWSSSALGEPAVFRFDAVSGATLPPQGAEPADGPRFLVSLASGDRLPCRSVRLKDGKMALTTGWSSDLNIPLDSVQRISRVPKTLYRLDGSEDGWEIVRGQIGWRIQGSSLVTDRPACIGRRLDFPKRFRVGFDLASEATPDLVFAFLVPSFEQAGSGGFGLRFRGGSADFYRNTSAAASSTTRVNVPALAPRGSARIDILVDSEARRVVLVCNGQTIREVVSAEPFQDGNGMVFLAQQAGITIKDLMIAAWDGEVIAAEIEGAAGPQEGTRVALANGDFLSGELIEVGEKSILMETAFGKAPIPIETVTEIRFPDRPETEAVSSGRGVAVELQGDGKIALELETLDQQELRGTQGELGPIEIRRSAIRAITRQGPLKSD